MAVSQAPALPPVWRDPNFQKVWIGGMVSSLGSAITRLAIPLIAIGAFQATPQQMGVLRASEYAAFLIFGLLPGVLVDRASRRIVLFVTSIAAACIVAVVPLANALGLLRIEVLYLVSFAAGCVGVIAEVAFQAFLPQLAGRDRILPANALVRFSGATTEVVGPSLAGLLIQLLTAPIAMIWDALSFFVAAVLMFRVEVSDRAPRRRGAVGADIVEGLRHVVQSRALRSIALGGGIHNFFNNGIFAALFVLYVNQTLGIGAATLGIIMAAAGPGALLGSAVASSYSRRFGTRRTLVHSQALTGLATTLVPLAFALSIPVVALIIAEFLIGLARSVFNINQLALRQALTPDELQGRMSASIRFLMWVLVPVGAVLGGILGQRLGLVPALAVAAIGTLLSALCFLQIPTESHGPSSA